MTKIEMYSLYNIHICTFRDEQDIFLCAHFILTVNNHAKVLPFITQCLGYSQLNKTKDWALVHERG